MDTLPAEQGGALILGLWVNALLTLALQSAQLVLIARGVRTATRSDNPTAAALDLVVSPSTAAVIGASAVHSLGRQYFLRLLDRRMSAAKLSSAV
jgi:hypothetical protein